MINPRDFWAKHSTNRFKVYTEYIGIVILYTIFSDLHGKTFFELMAILFVFRCRGQRVRICSMVEVGRCPGWDQNWMDECKTTGSIVTVGCAVTATRELRDYRFEFTFSFQYRFHISGDSDDLAARHGWRLPHPPTFGRFHALACWQGRQINNTKKRPLCNSSEDNIQMHECAQGPFRLEV